MKNLYLLVTLDEYELPLAVADSLKELSAICGTPVGVISSTMSHQRRGDIKRSRFVRVKVEDDFI